MTRFGVTDAMDIDNITSRQIIADYVNHKLETKGYEWPNRPEEPPNRINLMMRRIADQFERRYTDIFEDMCGQMNITPDTAYPTFIGIVHHVYTDGITWGRVVAIFAFGGSLAVHCIEQEMPDIVDSIVEWVATYVDNDLQPWINENGGWAGFVDFFEQAPERVRESPWPWRTMCSIAAGLGVVALGTILSNR